MKAFLHVLSNLAFTALVLAGWVYSLEGARNVVHLWIWLCVVAAILMFCFFDKAAEETAKKPGRSVIESGAHAVTMLFSAGVLAWHGSMGYACIVIMCVLITAAVYSKAEEIREAGGAA